MEWTPHPFFEAADWLSLVSTQLWRPLPNWLVQSKISSPQVLAPHCIGSFDWASLIIARSKISSVHQTGLWGETIDLRPSRPFRQAFGVLIQDSYTIMHHQTPHKHTHTHTKCTLCVNLQEDKLYTTINNAVTLSGNVCTVQPPETDLFKSCVRFQLSIFPLYLA